MITTATARTAHGLRLYAVGDIHGDFDGLKRARHQIADDLLRRPTEDWRVVLLGNYIDRGAKSREVLALLSALDPAARTYCLAGNREKCLTDFLADADAASFYPWLDDGGLATLASYGIEASSPFDFPDAAARRDLRVSLAENIPPAQAAFLAGLAHGARFGDYFFAHAGIRPGRPIAAQTVSDLIWAPGFLDCATPFEAVVIHGHSPVRSIEVHANRIAIDTGASHGPSCLVLEGADRLLLTDEGPCYLPAPQPDADVDAIPAPAIAA
ncbi:MAG: metallophosphoesterase [Pseudomonadota bacterium]